MQIPCPGIGNRIALFGDCDGPMVYSILVTPVLNPPPGPAPPSPRDANGQMPHILLVMGDPEAEWKEIGNGTIGTFREGTDNLFEVEFDAGTFSCPGGGAIFLTGGDPTVNVEIACFKHPSWKPWAHPHRLTTQVQAGTTFAIPNYHERISGWVTRAGTLLEGFPITLGQFSLGCIPGTIFTNPGGATLMIVTEWPGCLS